MDAAVLASGELRWGRDDQYIQRRGQESVCGDAQSVVLFAVIFICATVVLLVLLRALLPLSGGNLLGSATYLATLCATTLAYRWLTVRFPGEKGAPTFRRQVEVLSSQGSACGVTELRS